MGFFDGFKKGWEEAEKRNQEEKELQIKWEKEHPGEKFSPIKAGIVDVKPKEKKLYQPGHKNMTGPAKKNALINLLGTPDLDEVIEGCAPHFTETVYGIRDKLNDEEQDYKAKYYELKGRYDELLKQNQELLQIVKNK